MGDIERFIGGTSVRISIFLLTKSGQEHNGIFDCWIAAYIFSSQLMMFVLEVVNFKVLIIGTILYLLRKEYQNYGFWETFCGI